MNRLAEVMLAFAVKGVLGRLTGEKGTGTGDRTGAPRTRDGAGPAEPQRAAATAPRGHRGQWQAFSREPAGGDGPAAPVPHRRLLMLMIGSLIVGVALMVPFEWTVTRILGVIALFTFIVSGVFLIADPGWLASERE